MTLRVLVCLLVLGLPVPVAAQVELNEEYSREYQTGYDLYRRMNAYKQVTHPVCQENSLRSALMLRWYYDNMDKRLLWVERQDWTRDYKDMFVRAVQWRKKTFDDGAEKLYRLSHKYAQAPNAEKYGYDDVALWLLYYAAMAGHSKAYTEYENHPSKPSNAILLRNSRVHEYSGAVREKRWAIGGLVVTYLLDPIFDDDLLKGYYWLKRSGGLDVSKTNQDKLLKAISVLSQQDRDLAMEWIKSGHVPPM